MTGSLSRYWIDVTRPVWTYRAATGRWYQTVSTVVMPRRIDPTVRASHAPVTTATPATTAAIDAAEIRVESSGRRGPGSEPRPARSAANHIPAPPSR